MKRLLWFALAASLFPSLPSAKPPAQAQAAPALVAPEKVGLSSERLGKAAAALKGEIEKGRLPGTVLLVARRGKIAWFQSLGFLDKGAGKPMTNDAIFRAYSMTKPWVSVVTMMLVEEGKLQLTDPLSKFLPAMKGLQVSVGKREGNETTWSLVPAEREATVQDLLRHTSGLAYDFVTRNAPVKEAYDKAGLKALDPAFLALTPAEVVERFSKAPLAYQPGTTWEYSFATDVLGRVVEAVIGQRLSQVVAERLLAPMGMVDSGFVVPAAKAARIAQPLPVDPATSAPNVVFDVTREPANDSGGAGGVTTALDYFRFGQMLLQGGQYGGKRYLSRTTVALMTSDHLGSRIQAPLTPGELLMGVPGYTFGLGFMVRQGPGIAGVPGSAGEFAWAGAAGTFFWVDPKEDLVVVFMSQAPGPSRGPYRRFVKALVTQAIAD
jgi:CubicO group peptidase (beta-lactamase class C family)